nr:MAG TPA: hypothetical protein [Caudoviricetes sp.]DAM03612.1 MAG TPA: hypothetical protein [Caudoviricetes sp.]
MDMEIYPLLRGITIKGCYRVADNISPLYC